MRDRISTTVVKVRAASAGLAAAILAACASSAPPAQPQVSADLSDRCAGLAGHTVAAAAFALPTGAASVTDAVWMAADAEKGLPDFCRLRGAIAAANPDDPSILFQVNLPADWNHKTVQFGGGGLNGVVIEGTRPFTGGGGAVPTALAQGYVTYGSDSGHQGATRDFYDNPQAFSNYAHEAVKRTKDLVTVLVREVYGQDARRNYHIGGSKGGQEGLQAAQRYAADFDGVVSYYPAAQNQSLTLGWNRLWHFAYGTPGGALNTAEQALLKAAVLTACDTLDDAADGLVSDTRGCAARFDVQTLRCPQGADAGDACLSDVQIAALKAADARFDFAHPMPNDVRSVGPWPVFIGGDLNLWFGDGTNGSQQAFYRWPAARPEALDDAKIDIAAWRADVEAIAKIYDASNPDLDTFQRKGGKLILVQGTTDMLVPPSMTDGYFAALQGRYGERLPDFVRYFVVPGYGHGFGAFTMQWNSLAALDAWVEGGAPPLNQVITDGTPGKAGRTRPLCEYPTWPKHVGPGAADVAQNFTCAGG